MPSRKPAPGILPWLAALSAAPLVLIVVAIGATKFGGVDLAVSYDLLTWKVARILAWVALAGALAAAVLALRDVRGRGAYAAAALVLAGATVGGFQWRQARNAQPGPRDVSTNTAEPPAFSRLSAPQAPLGNEASCPGAQALPTQVLAQQASSAMVDAGFQVVRATTFEIEGVHQGAWFGFAHHAVIRIRPGRTDLRVVAANPRPDVGATCRLATKLSAALAENAR